MVEAKATSATQPIPNSCAPEEGSKLGEFEALLSAVADAMRAPAKPDEAGSGTRHSRSQG